jgi:mono/diheme cytochrome c family protein
MFVEENCAACHAIGGDDESTLAEAPAFRTLHQRYPVEFLAEALAEGIVTAHLAMPVFQLEPDQIDDVIAYLKSLEN